MVLVLNSTQNTFASDVFSYSGRLVNVNGSPVPGLVNLTFELAYSDQPSVVLCSQQLDGVSLVNGVFQVKLPFGSCNIPDILANTPAGHTVGIRVIDRTPDPDRVYSYQAIHSVPYSIVAKQLVQMGAVDGQVLTWSGGQWRAATPSPAGDTVTPIIATDGLSGGTITETGIVGIANDGVTSAKILDGTIVDADISSTAEIEQSKIKDLVTALSAKETSIASGLSTDYLNGTKNWNNFDQSVRNALLIGYSTGAATPLSATDNVIEALGKLEGQIIANDTAFDSSGQWEKSGSLIYYNSGNVGIGTGTPGEKLDVVGNIALSGKIRLKDSGSNYVELKSPATIGGTVTFTLPGALGTNGQVLVTDASGNLSWSTPSTSSADIVDGSIVNADVSASANIAQSKISNLVTDLAAKEPTLTAGTTAQYLRGDKSWQTLNTDAVVEGTNLYFTEPRVLGTDLAGLSAVAGSVTAADSVLSAIGKLTGNQSNYVLKAGDSMSGNLLMGGNNVTGLGAPLLDSDAATKLYVDTEVSNKAHWTKTVNDLSYTTGNVGVGTATPTNKLDVVGDVALSGKLRLKSDNANYVELKAPLGLASTQTYTFPSSLGTSGYALTTNGAGTLAWSAVATTSTSVGGDLSGTIANAQLVSGAVGSAEIADLSIVGADIAATTITYGKLNLVDGDIPQAKVNGLVTALSNKEPTITAGTTAQYWRGDKSWQTLNTTVVPEGTNLYFLDSRVRGALMSGYAAGSATPLAATDTLLEALAKLEGQIIANKAAFDSTGQWSKNGTSVYYSGGNVGIGTASPNNPFVIKSTIPQFLIENGTKFYNFFNDGSSFLIREGATSLFTISASGNIGIGTTSPSNKLQVAGDARIGAINPINTGTLPGYGNYLYFSGGPSGGTWNSDNSDPLWMARYNSDSDMTELRVNIGDGSSTTDRFAVGTGNGTFSELLSVVSNGNVGIGTTTPEAKLHVHDSTATNASGRIKSTTTNTAATIQSAEGLNRYFSSPVAGLEIITNTNHPISFGVNEGGSGTPEMTIATSGNVGIGTSSPTSKLDVTGDAHFSNTTFYDSTVSVPTATYVPINLSSAVTTLTAGNVYRVQLVVPVTATPTGAVYNVYQTATSTWVANMVSANGNVSNHPLLRVNVAGTGLEVYHNHATTYSIHAIVKTMTTGNVNLTASTFFGLEGAITNYGGNIGIGTSTPSSTNSGLDISSGGLSLVLGAENASSSRNNATDKLARIGSYHYTVAEEPIAMMIASNTATANSLFIGGGTSYMNAATNISFTTASNTTTTVGSERMRITNTGNVGIGTTSPQSILHLATPAPYITYEETDTTQKFFTGVDGSGWWIRQGTTGNTDIMTVRNTGNVGIGVTTPGYRLQVGSAGDGSEARANAWNALSDERLKKDFALIESPLEKLLGIDGYTYFWKQGSDAKKKIGLKAQEVKKVFPEAVSKGSDGYYSLSYDHLVAPIIGAIKELYNKWLVHEAEIKKVKEENEELKLRNLALEERMDRLEKIIQDNQKRRPASVKVEPGK